MSPIRQFLRRTFSNPNPYSLRQSARLSRNRTCYLPLDLPLQSRIRWSYLWYASILALGLTTGLGARHFAGPLGLPVPGSKEDELILESLCHDIDNLEIVKSLRAQSYNLSTDASLRSGPGLGSGGGGRKISAYKDWVELDLDFGKNQDAKKSILDVMSGTRGLGVQRVFWNAESKEMVAVVWIGGGLSGWPGVAHGGAIATIFEEVMTRMTKGPEGHVEPKHRPTSLSVTYAKPTYSLDFYVLRASFTKPNLPQTEPPAELAPEPAKSWLSWLSPQKDLTKKESPNTATEIVGTLESIKGDLCVRVKGAFTTPVI